MEYSFKVGDIVKINKNVIELEYYHNEEMIILACNTIFDVIVDYDWNKGKYEIDNVIDIDCLILVRTAREEKIRKLIKKL